MRRKFVLKSILIMLLIIFAFSAISNIVYAINEEQNDTSTELIISNYEKELVDINQPIEIVTEENVSFPTINEVSLNLINELDIEISENDEIKKIYDNSIDREVTRVISDSAEVDFDNYGNIVTFKNLDDYSTEDKNRRNYIEGVALPTITYEITNQTDLADVISQVDDLYDLTNYELVDCSNDIEEAWTLTWCRDYGNNLINPYECINLVVDAKDGSITILGKNSMVPNATVAVITADQASSIANSIVSQYGNNNIKTKLTFFRPNFYWEDEGPFETADFVRLSWEVYIEDIVSVQVDALTGEILGGYDVQSTDCGRSLSVVNFVGQANRAQLAYNALNTLGYNQSAYPPVSWSINQADIDWVLSRPDCYGLYLNCHGGIINGVSVLGDSSILQNCTWTKWSNTSYGNWHFVYLDACLTSANTNFANAFNATGSGRCFVGWNISIAASTAYDFDQRFFSKLGHMTVYNAVVEALWESRNAGYNSGNALCDPGFIGDSNYYGWAW